MYVEAIPSWATKQFILHIHYARRMPSITYAFGLFDDYELIGVCTFGSPASPSLCIGVAGKKNKNNVIELNRLVILPERNGSNCASFLVSHALRMLPSGTFVVSYADWGGWHHIGYVYQATNFIYTGMTKRRTDKYSDSGHSRHYKKDEVRRQIRTEKHRYIYLCGTKKDKKRMMKELKYKVMEYPKGDSKKYDVTDPRMIAERKENDQTD